MEYGDQVEVDPKIQIVVDALGEPYVSLNIQLPPGTAMSANACDQLALKLLAASAAVRVRAACIQKQMLMGHTRDQAIAVADAVLGDQ